MLLKSVVVIDDNVQTIWGWYLVMCTNNNDIILFWVMGIHEEKHLLERKRKRREKSLTNFTA